MGIQPASEVTEKEPPRLPVAAMNKDDDRAFVVAGEEINGVARAGP